MKTTKVKLNEYLGRFIKDLGSLDCLTHKTVVDITINAKLMDNKINELTDKILALPGWPAFKADMDKEHKWFTEKHPEAKRGDSLPQQLRAEWDEKLTKVNKKHPKTSKQISEIEHGEIEIEFKPVKDFTNVPMAAMMNFPEIFILNV